MKSWRLLKNEEELGVLTLDSVDQPFLYCRFEPLMAFEKWRALFERELELGEQEDVSEADFAEACRIYDEELAPGLKLVACENGEEIIEFMLHIAGNRAWFRY